MHNKVSNIGTCSVVPGRLTRGELEIAHFEGAEREVKDIEVPVYIASGLDEGPTVVILSGLKGTDISSVASVYHLIEHLDIQKLKGTLIYLPIINTSGYFAQSKAHPYDGKLIEKSFPGSINGSVSEQIASTLLNDVFVYADLVINISDVEEVGVSSQLYTRLVANQEMIESNDIQLQKSLLVGSELLLTEMPMETDMTTEIDQKYKIPTVSLVIGAKGSKQMQHAVEQVMLGVQNLLIRSEMYEGEVRIPEIQYVVRDLPAYYTSIGGILHTMHEIGDYVEKGETIAVVLNPESGDKLEVKSDVAGFIYQSNQAKRILKGDKVFSIISTKADKLGKKPRILSEAIKVIKNSEVEEPTEV
jgi:uncharacterized protein